MNPIVPYNRMVEILSARDAALSEIRTAVDLMVQAHSHATKSLDHALIAHKGDRFYEVNRQEQQAYQRLFVDIDPEASLKAFRQQLDASTWVHIIRATGMEALMDQTAKDDFLKSLAGDVPEVTEDNIRATMEGLAGDAQLIFARGLARVFCDLDRRFRSHDGFKLGARIILTYAFDSWGSFNYRFGEKLADVERVFAVLDGDRDHDVTSLTAAINADRGGGFSRRQSVTETTYFRAKGYMNGNLHLWFTRDDLVEKANQVLADYYGKVFPDAVPDHNERVRDRQTTTALSKDLAFYPTPPAVVSAMLRETYIQKGDRVLEPSAGTGNIAKAALDKGANVYAVEVDQCRYEVLKGIRHPELTAVHANFLDMPPTPIYAHVLMNPPFYGRHWMSHVMHAYKFLAPGGTLVAVLPVTAELSESEEHEAFRAWARERNGNRYLFRDLPPESFASSGTRINTVLLHLRGRYL